MAAVLAHEINNPLSGILTYAKLLRKWIEHEDGGRSRRGEICDSLDLIASESRRCGDLVKNLLTFSRTTPMNLQPTNLNQVIDRSLRLVQHQIDLGGIQVQLQLDPESAARSVRCSSDRTGRARAGHERDRRDAAGRQSVDHHELHARRKSGPRSSCAMTAAAFRRKSCRGSSNPFSPPRKPDAASGWDSPSATAFWSGITEASKCNPNLDEAQLSP